MARGPSRRDVKDVELGEKKASQQKKASRFKGNYGASDDAVQRQSAEKISTVERKRSEGLKVGRKSREDKKMARTLVETSSCPVELRQGASGWCVLLVCL